MGWTADVAEIAALSPACRARLDALRPMQVDAGNVLFRPGDSVQGYVIVLKGRIGVYLVGPNGREILLYDVVPGSSCIQSTLGILGGDDYSAEAMAETDARLVLLPRAIFLELLDSDAGFRRLVFQAFAGRMQSTMHLLERVAFHPLDARLAAFLVARAEDGAVSATQQEIANAIGSAREVVSRRLDAMGRRGWLTHARGRVTILREDALRLAAEDAG
ncbi:MAG: Crp/Fnr family transcriptional regulator [Silicimonas sp.]|nr:Crp/Fnr family transcriptional regulator [Silicimonas sp.]NNL72522.1 Crp/Fnr family transcriptional regulator [Silicimonas sp.]